MNDPATNGRGIENILHPKGRSIKPEICNKKTVTGQIPIYRDGQLPVRQSLALACLR